MAGVPPRFAFWTILIDGKPTAFRARDPQELLPTCNQLKRTNQDVVIRWFARGRLWESPEAERAANQRPKPPIEKRGRDWRPGGAHKDPRDRFKKKNRPERAWSPNDGAVRRDRDTIGSPREPRPWTLSGPRRADRPWQTKPSGPRADRKPWKGKPSGPGGSRPRKPWTPTPPGQRMPWTGKPVGSPSGDRPWQTKQSGPGAGRNPWQGKPFGKPAAGAHGKPAGPGGPGPRKPWAGKPGDLPRGEGKPWKRKPFRPLAGPLPHAPRKKRDDEPPDRG